MHCTLIAATGLTQANLIWAALLCVLLLAVVVAVWMLRRNWPTVVALTRHPFAKYVALSVVAHVGLAIWIFTSQLFEVADPGPGPAAVVVQIGADFGEDHIQPANPEPKPWDAPPFEAVDAPTPELPPQATESELVERPQPNLAEDMRVDSPLADLPTIPPQAVESPTPFADAQQPRTAAALTQTELVAEPPVATLEQNAVGEDNSTDFSKSQTQQQPELSEQPERFPDAEAIAAHQDSLEPTMSNSLARFMKPETAEAPATTPEETRFATVPVAATPSNRLERLKTGWDNQPERVPIGRATTPLREDGRALPSIYRDRWAADRLAIARARGGSEDTELAVQAALKWLAAAQNTDGRWDASEFGSGKPNPEGGHDRRGAGMQADTAVTGLAVLAFLGSGHTHKQGEYSAAVRNGLNYLIQAQRKRTDGSVVGNATGFAAMYCHGIATLALSEAYSLTGDSNLLQSVEQAIRFTLAAQHPTKGGWRYTPWQNTPHDPGDTSQLGWQLMALTSAYYSGMQIPPDTWTRAGYFLDNVSSGSHRGLAAYRPGQRPTPAMTAEAALCRLFLGTRPDSRLVSEAASFMLTDLPGSGRVNFYYWYYGTLALYHMQDAGWQRWNSAVKRELLQLQTNNGSWDADSVWGPSGGKVYSTALAALTLEVYYRYRPLAEPRRAEHTAWHRD